MAKTYSDSDDFYESLSPVYDRMTRFSQRLDSERAMLAAWQKKYSFTSVLDAACGTGLHAIALAQLGVEVVATDISAAMLTIARQHAEEMGVDVEWLQAPMQGLREVLQERFDMIFCLGNSLPHLLDSTDLVKTLEGFHALLNPNGHVLLQLVNYDRILSQQERIIAIHQYEKQEFIRFYDFSTPYVDFNVLRVDWKEALPRHHLDTTRLYPYRFEELQRGLMMAGFSGWQTFGDMNGKPFVAVKSPNIVLAAKY